MLLPDTCDELAADQWKELRGHDGDVKASGGSTIRGFDHDRGPGDHWQGKVGRLNTLWRHDQNASVRSVPRPAGPTLGCIDAGTALGLVVGNLLGHALLHGGGHRFARLEPRRSHLIVSGTADGGHSLLDLGNCCRSHGGTREPESKIHSDVHVCYQPR